MFLNACGDGKNVGIKNNVLCREAQSTGEELIAARADFDFPFQAICLAIFVEGHHDDCGTILQA